jgi:alpha-tubulin suppressor-like RCC1 family protein
VPVAGGRRYSALGGGFLYTCGLSTAGAAYCWGTNDARQLGSGTTVDSSSTPLQVVGGLTFTTLAVGGAHVCGITPSGAVYCWGNNFEGELGDGTTSDRSVPVAAGGSLRFASISLGAFHTCGVATNGVGYCWGDGAFGELGTGTTSSSAVPVAVAVD